MSIIEAYYSVHPTNPQAGDICLKVYSDLLNGRTIKVFYNPGGNLFARFYVSDSKGATTNSSQSLPLDNMPKNINQRDIKQLTRFFAHTHLILEKGIDGNYNRVAVHVSGKGGGKTIPFQPGLALGSIVRGTCIDKMEEYAGKTFQEAAWESEIRQAEQEIQVLEAKINSKRARLESDKGKGKEKKAEGEKEDYEISRDLKKIKRHERRIKALENHLDELDSLEIPIFENFTAGIRSPFKIKQDCIEIQSRAFDSCCYSSCYIDLSQDLSQIHDRVTVFSGSNDVSASGGAWLIKAKVSQTWSDAISKRLAQIKQEGSAEKVLVINSTVTTRYVKCLVKMNYHKHALKTILDAMKRANEEECKRYGITIREDGRKEIYLLTEAIMGGSFTGLVTFRKESKMQREASKVMKESSSLQEASIGGSIKNFHNLNFNAGGSHSRHEGYQNEDDTLQNIAVTKVSVEFSSEGCLPTLNREEVVTKMFDYLNLDLSNIGLSQTDETDLIKAKDSDARAKAASLDRKKKEKGQIAALNALRKLLSREERQSLHTANSIFEAYESFAKKMTDDPDCGIPIGFGYDILTQEEIEELLKNQG